MSDSQSEAGVALGVEAVDRHRLERLIDAIADPELRHTQRTRFRQLLPSPPPDPRPEPDHPLPSPLYEAVPRRRQLRKRAFTAIYPYIADQIRYLRLANINDVNALYQETQDYHAVLRTLDGMYQRHKRRFPHDDKYKPESFQKIVGDYRRKAATATATAAPSQQPELQSQSIPDLVADNVFDFEASEASQDSDVPDDVASDESDTLAETIRVGGRVLSHRLALRGVLPELAKRQAIWKPRAPAKRPRIVTPNRKGVARIKPLHRRHQSDRDQLRNELINDADDEEDEGDALVLITPRAESEADILAREAQRFEQYAYVFDDVDPNEPEPAYNQMDLVDVGRATLTPPSPPSDETPPSPISVYSDDSDILEYDRVVLDVPSRPSPLPKLPAAAATVKRKPQAPRRPQHPKQPRIKPRPRAPARVQARLVLERNGHGLLYHQKPRGFGGPQSIEPLNTTRPLKVAKASTRSAKSLPGTARSLTATTKPSTAARVKSKAQHQSRLPSPYVAPQFTLQIEAEAPNEYIQRHRFRSIIPIPYDTTPSTSEFDVEKMAKGTFFMDINQSLSLQIGSKQFTLSPIQPQSNKVYHQALNTLADQLNSSLDLTGVFVNLTKWQVFLRPQIGGEMLQQLVARCQASQWLPYIMLLALAAEQIPILEQAALQYWQALWHEESVPTTLASEILKATRLWSSLLTLALTSAPSELLEYAVSMVAHAIDVSPIPSDWSVIYVLIRRLNDCEESSLPNRALDLILHVYHSHQWVLEERIVIELYGVVSRRKFANYPDECHDPEIMSVIKLREDFGSSFFERFLMILYIYVGDLPVEDHQTYKNRLNAKLYILLLLQYHELRDQFIIYVNRLNFTLLLHQVLGLLLRTQFDQLVKGVVLHALSVEYTTLQTSVQAVQIYCETTQSTEQIPMGAIAALLARFALEFLRIPHIMRIWRLFLKILLSLRSHSQFPEVLSNALLSSLPLALIKDILPLSRNIPPNQELCEKIELVLNRAMNDNERPEFILLLVELWVRSGRDNLTRIVFGQLPYLGDKRLQQFYSPLILAWVLRFAQPNIKSTFEDACYDRIWQLVILSLAPSPYLGQLLSGLSLPTTLGSNTDMIVRLLDYFRKRNNTSFIRGYLDQVKALWNAQGREPNVKKLYQFCVVELKRRFAQEVKENRQFASIVTETQIDRTELDVIDWLRQPLHQKLQQFYHSVATVVELKKNVEMEIRKYLRLDAEVIMYAMVNYFKSWNQAVPWLLQVILREWLKFLPDVRLTSKLLAFYREMLQWIIRYPQLENDVVNALHQLLIKVSGYVDVGPRDVAWEYIKGKQVDSQECLMVSALQPQIPNTDVTSEPLLLPSLVLNRHRLLNRLEEIENREAKPDVGLLEYEFVF